MQISRGHQSLNDVRFQTFLSLYSAYENSSIFPYVGPLARLNAGVRIEEICNNLKSPGRIFMKYDTVGF